MRFSLMCGGILLLTALRASLSLAAEPAPPAGLEMEDEVVVQAWHPSPAQIDDFVREALPTKGAKQLARWYRPVCTVVLGLPPAQAALVQHRLQAAATGPAELPPPRPGCKPNIAIFATDDPDGLIEGLIQRYPTIYRPDLTGEFRRILAKPRDAGGAIRVWYRTVTTSSVGLSPEMAGEGGRVTPVFSSVFASRIVIPVRSEMLRVLMILDPRQVQGRGVEAVADHMAMLALGQFDGDVAAGIPTILNLFSGDPAVMPTVMTEWDKTMLRGLYAAQEDRTIWSQRRDVVRHMREAIEKP
ncbi:MULTISPECIES: hypothetical protein [unclassified Azospirillum]|uniref:hypothetical protein n=1 Tax=unclassified Azospirillum TaxID=2630922 RepID=UPI000B738F8C|nr:MULTISPECIES: hypothetical protein [unclassified Azospirillum]SNR90167.1 hypothetical protein SAMN05880556_101424 [Azospirillum sp. RU38E]SNS06163.1 hypothetical protein SAMN05880591_101424 [Azospirillum sp. RU37A]